MIDFQKGKPMKSIPAILTAALDGAMPLGDRVSAVLSTPAAPSAAVAALLAEVTEALGAARSAARQAEASALDPVLNTVAADHESQVAQAANFAARRLEAAETRLTEFHAQRAQEELEAEQWKRYRAVEKKRDALAERIKREYPDLARGMVDLITAEIDAWLEIRKVNADLPPGAQLLNRPDAQARGYIDNGRDGTPGARFGTMPLAAAVIPDPANFEMAIWPPLLQAGSGLVGTVNNWGNSATGRYADIKFGRI